jgi:hypothetical protein
VKSSISLIPKAQSQYLLWYLGKCRDDTSQFMFVNFKVIQCTFQIRRIKCNKCRSPSSMFHTVLNHHKWSISWLNAKIKSTIWLYVKPEMRRHVTTIIWQTDKTLQLTVYEHFEYHRPMIGLDLSLTIEWLIHALIPISPLISWTPQQRSKIGSQSGAVVRSMFEINISACHHWGCGFDSLSNPFLMW